MNRYTRFKFGFLLTMLLLFGGWYFWYLYDAPFWPAGLLGLIAFFYMGAQKAQLDRDIKEGRASALVRPKRKPISGCLAGLVISPFFCLAYLTHELWVGIAVFCLLALGIVYLWQREF